MGPFTKIVKWKINMKSSYLRAFNETLFIWVFSSLVPILSLWFIGALLQQEDSAVVVGFSSSVKGFFIPSEIFLYTTTILAPSVAFMIFHWRARRSVGLYNACFLAIISLVFVTGIVYALSKAGLILNDTVLLYTSILVYVLAIIVWYLVKVFEFKLGTSLSEPSPQSGDSIMDKL